MSSEITYTCDGCGGRTMGRSGGSFFGDAWPDALIAGIHACQESCARAALAKLAGAPLTPEQLHALAEQERPDLAAELSAARVEIAQLKAVVDEHNQKRTDETLALYHTFVEMVAQGIKHAGESIIAEAVATSRAELAGLLRAVLRERVAPVRAEVAYAPVCCPTCAGSDPRQHPCDANGTLRFCNDSFHETNAGAIPVNLRWCTNPICGVALEPCNDGDTCARCANGAG